MRIHVDPSGCQNLGQCVFAAPDVFDMDDAGELVYAEEVSEALRPDVLMAVDACPVQAITVTEPTGS